MRRPTAWQVLAGLLGALALGSAVLIMTTPNGPPRSGPAARVVNVFADDITTAPSAASLRQQLDVDSRKLLAAGALVEVRVTSGDRSLVNASRPAASDYRPGPAEIETVSRDGQTYRIVARTEEPADLAGLRWRSTALQAVTLAMLVLAAGGLWVSRRRHAEQERITLLDPLTGVGNRRLLDRQAARLLRGPGRGHHHALLLIDLDGFKQLNDQHGHAYGDLVLRRLADGLQNVVRPGDHVVRLGGDEFAVLLESLPTTGEATIVSDVLARLRGRLPEVGISAGAAFWPQDGTDLESLMACADSAMYEDKGRRTLDVRTRVRSRP